MTAVRLVLFAVFGLAFGSFLTVVIHRIPRKEALIGGRSRCPACEATISARDNVPIVSYLLLRGRCRHCEARISPRYPLVELATAALFAAASLIFADLYVAGVMAVFLGVLLALAAIDIEHRVLPNAVVYPSLGLFTLAVVLGALLGRELRLVDAALGFLAFGGAVFAVALVSPRGMGMGDVKLAALMGLVLGSQGLRYVAVAAGLAVLAGGVGGIVALIAGRSRKSTIPFGPYLAAGATASALWGGAIARWYLSLLR
jgi:leader peptidase (prepilin peptidase)/N-methyltransferase